MRLIGLELQDVVRLLVLYEVVCGLHLGVQRIGGDDPVGDVQGLQQTAQPRNLVGLAGHRLLGDHDPLPMEQRRQQVGWRLPVAGARQGLPVDRDRFCRPLAQDDPISVHLLQGPTEGGLAGGRMLAANVPRAKAGQQIRRQVTDPLGDLHEVLLPG